MFYLVAFPMDCSPSSTCSLVSFARSFGRQIMWERVAAYLSLMKTVAVQFERLAEAVASIFLPRSKADSLPSRPGSAPETLLKCRGDGLCANGRSWLHSLT
ncbi:unnamed protein product [Symbiodinium sp. CCMP2592]|nr:unnamed protein product [Symbiodinium sp. CCMP2592]